MSEILRECFVPPGVEDFQPYLFDNKKLPPISVDRLSMGLLIGDERTVLRVNTTGDASLIIRYKKREGVVSSMALPNQDLSLVQLQGSNQEGYRIDTGMYWVNFFADRLWQLASHPRSGLKRLTMPTFDSIPGFADAVEEAMKRYKDFARMAKLDFSKEEKLWVRDVNS